ncbi:MAG: hypothetical protein Q9200_005230, partial [Gallowayella weberi]
MGKQPLRYGAKLMPFEALKELVSPLMKRSPFKTPKSNPAMPAPVQTSDPDAALPSEKSEKSNSWSAAQRMDIFNRRQQGEKWDTIIVIMKKQAML